VGESGEAAAAVGQAEGDTGEEADQRADSADES
jgi:hypothetical protein